MKTAKLECPLLERTISLVNNAPRSISFAEMARQIDVSPSWIAAFAKSKIDDPGIRKVEKLHSFLTNVG